ncbi:hypothetical protein TNCV_3843771 [Trichonephila clavipes]|nr:hypothetical protein TNCV_3843771 [Trichonephila clavipes]
MVYGALSLDRSCDLLLLSECLQKDDCIRGHVFIWQHLRTDFAEIDYQEGDEVVVDKNYLFQIMKPTDQKFGKQVSFAE